MSDNLTRYCAIRNALFKLSPPPPQGNIARHLLTLAHMVSGIVGSRRSNLPAMAAKTLGGQRESRIKRFSRWLANDRVQLDAYFLPVARALLASLPAGPLVLIMDGSLVGRGCQALVISVLYRTPKGQRALPLVWSVVRGGKGHLSEQMHQSLVRQVAALIPEGRAVIFLGDGEYNGINLLRLIGEQGWQFVCRIGKNSKLCEEDEWFSLSWRSLHPGEAFELPNVLFTEHGLGPVLVTGRWKHGEDGPLYLVTPIKPEQLRSARRSILLVPAALRDRDLLFGSEEPWLLSGAQSPERSDAPVAASDRHGSCLCVAGMSGGAYCWDKQAECAPPPGSL